MTTTSKQELGWREAIAVGLFGGIFVVGGFLLAVFLMASVVDTAVEWSDHHNQCLKRATNGLEIKRCR